VGGFEDELREQDLVAALVHLDDTLCQYQCFSEPVQHWRNRLTRNRHMVLGLSARDRASRAEGGGRCRLDVGRCQDDTPCGVSVA
jgi:hypothetical protein